MAATPVEATTIKEAADMLAKRSVFLRFMKQAGGLSDYIEPAMQKGVKLMDEYVPKAKEFYSQNATPINYALGGAGLGAAMGGLSGLTSPDPDRRKPFSSAVMGGLAGGALGGGAGLIAQHGPDLMKLMQGSKDINDANKPSGGWLGQIWPKGEFSATDPTGLGAKMDTVGGPWAGNTARAAVPAAAATEFGLWRNRANNASNPLAQTNMQAGATAYAQDKTLREGLLESLKLSPRTPAPPIADPGALHGSLSDLSGRRVPYYGAASSLEKSRFATFVKQHGPDSVSAEPYLKQIGRHGMTLNNAAAGTTGARVARGLGIGGRLAAWAALPFIASRLQPNTTPTVPTNFADMIRK